MINKGAMEIVKHSEWKEIVYPAEHRRPSELKDFYRKWDELYEGETH